jgi:hypothetical protein
MAYTPTHQPSGFETCVQYVVPEVPRRGSYHKDSTGTTRCSFLGLTRPEMGAWCTTLDATDSAGPSLPTTLSLTGA